MKSKIKIFVSIALASIVLLLNSGFTISHVHCSKGEQWIIGSEMPPLKHKSQSCKKFAKQNRKIEVYLFSFEFESEIQVEKQITTKTKINKTYLSNVNINTALSISHKVYKKTIYKPPLNYNTTCIIKLQQFLI